MILPKSLPSLIPNISYIIPVLDGGPSQATPMQGFAPSLLDHSGLVDYICTLPADIYELTPEGQKVFAARRISGGTRLSWYGQSLRALTSIVTPPIFPFLVICVGKDQDIELFSNWRKSHTFPITFLARDGGSINYRDFSIEVFREHFLKICENLTGQVNEESRQDAIQAISVWSEPPAKDLGYQVGGHNSIQPNLSVLAAFGYENSVYGPFKAIDEGDEPYLQQLSKTSKTILEERERVGVRAPERFMRPAPDINLFAPNIYPHFFNTLSQGPLSKDEFAKLKRVQQSLKRQSGYNFTTENAAEMKAAMGEGIVDGGYPSPHPLHILRAKELRLGTACMAARSSAELSATLRLPNAINRTSGAVRLFAQNYRSEGSKERTRQKVFKRTQDLIFASFPKIFLETLSLSRSGIRVVSDAHLEWLDVKGWPLCLQSDVSRIPVTPGNLFVQTMSSVEPIDLQVSDLSEILTISAFKPDDPISKMFKISIEGFEKHFAKRIAIRTAEVGTRKELEDAFNSYDGPLVLFDGHGSHKENKPGVLHLKDEEIDVWSLDRNEVRLPPIMLLSACDTHAADRNHATVANGFLSLGVRTVVASVFPLDARDAAVFTGRLLHRIANFIPLSHSMLERSVTWMEMLSGLLRMQFLTDYLRLLKREKLINHEQYIEIHSKGNMMINARIEDPFVEIDKLLSNEGVKHASLERFRNIAVANSSSISYLQIGRPETIVIHPEKDNENLADALIS
jgi:hypothetical protein